MISVFNIEENIVGKGENAGNQKSSFVGHENQGLLGKGLKALCLFADLKSIEQMATLCMPLLVI